MKLKARGIERRGVGHARRSEPHTGRLRHNEVMRPSAKPSSRLRLLALVSVCALLLGAVWLWRARDDGGAKVVSDSSHPGWMTIRYQGVRVDIPATWKRSNREHCEFQFEVWAPLTSKSCQWAGGVAFYNSATFDPVHKPGVRRTESRDEPEWGGYTFAGDFAVYASDPDRETALRVLESAR